MTNTPARMMPWMAACLWLTSCTLQIRIEPTDAGAVQVTPTSSAPDSTWTTPTRTAEATAEPLLPTTTPSFNSVTPSPQNPIPHLLPGGELTLTAIQMTDPTLGWAIGDVLGNHILRTQDGGRTWRDVTPPEPAAPPNSPAYHAVAAFLDSDRAWVTYFHPYLKHQRASAGIVWRTRDGGQTWEPGQSLDLSGATDFMPYWVLFIDEATGWIYASTGDQYSLYRTVDGGTSWSRMVIPEPGVQKWPDVEVVTGMVFADASTGLLTGLGAPSVYWTDDGGGTWIEQKLPSPTSFPSLFESGSSGTRCGTSVPVLFSATSASVVVRCSDDYPETGQPDSLLYRTEDRGQSWRTSSFPGNPNQCGALCPGSLIFFTPETALALHSSIWKTTDGGQNWTKIKEMNWEGSFTFVDEQRGWAIARAQGEGTGAVLESLVYTTDGGLTWQLIKPQIVP